jgi:antirestriction protein ArdC
MLPSRVELHRRGNYLGNVLKGTKFEKKALKLKTVRGSKHEAELGLVGEAKVLAELDLPRSFRRCQREWIYINNWPFVESPDSACRLFVVVGELHHAGYLSTWLKVLRTDKRAIFVAATRAQQAPDYILKLAQPPDREAMAA